MMENINPISKVRLGEFKTDGFDRGTSKSKEILWYFCKMLFFLNAFPFPSRWKCFLLRIFGAHIGNGCVIKPRVNIHFPWKLTVGNHVWIGEEAFLLNFELLKIGNNVCVSQRAFLCGGNHDFKDPAMKYRNGRIELNDGVWIGAGCFVGPGVTVGVDSVVTAGSVVATDLAANGIFKGNPITKVKNRW